MGPGERTRRFAEEAKREQPVAIDRSGCIDQHDVEITGQPSVLEPVVEQDDITPKLNQAARSQIPIRVRFYPEIWDTREHLRVLVSGLARLRLVPARRYARVESALAEYAHEPEDRGGLAGAARRYIADRDHRRVHTAHTPPAIEPLIPEMDRQPIQGSAQRPDGARHRWPRHITPHDNPDPLEVPVAVPHEPRRSHRGVIVGVPLLTAS